MDLKKEAAKKALSLINNSTIFGLGAGSTIGYLVELLQPQLLKGLCARFVTSSFSTLQLLLKYNLPVEPVASFKSIDIYFDGCDQVDIQLNALKSGGGIHTQEKLLASMAKRFVLLADESKLVKQFNASLPMVVELLPQAVRYVPAYIENHFPGCRIAYRISEKKDGCVITENGNYLLDVWFTQWPELNAVNQLMKSIAGVVETSLFLQLAHTAIIAGKDGVKILERGRNFRV